MKRTRIVSSLLAGMLFISFGAVAQEQPEQEPLEPGAAQPQPESPGAPRSEPPPAQPGEAPPDAEPFPEPAAEVTEDDLDTFAAIYSGLMETASRFEQEIAAAETVEEVQDAQDRMREDSIAAIEEEGWTLDKYNSIAQAINASPELAQEALRRIEEREAG